VTLVSDLDGAIIRGMSVLRGELRKFTIYGRLLRELLGIWRFGD
jgi:hypothetical protein